jgi:hypothetical protein
MVIRINCTGTVIGGTVIGGRDRKLGEAVSATRRLAAGRRGGGNDIRVQTRAHSAAGDPLGKRGWTTFDFLCGLPEKSVGKTDARSAFCLLYDDNT